jgi:peptidoglycan/LPS O-acetylase OafA/YrhL
MRIEAGRIRGFDGLRAIAFLLVFISHKIHFAQGDSIGSAGVWLFFVLSGFLITRILANSRTDIERGTATVSSSLWRFYLRRTARIFPPYYLLLAFFFVASFFVTIDHFWGAEKLAYLLYATNFLIAARNSWVGDFGHFWSLAVEEQFYLVFAPIVLLAPRKHTISVCIAIIATGLATKITLEARGAPEVPIDVNSLINFTLLGFGGVIGLMGRPPASKLLIGGGAQVAVLSLYLALPAVFGTWPLVWPLLGKLSAVLVGILLFQIFHGQQSWLVTALESSPLRKIGRISYGAYLIHPFLHYSAIEDLLRRFDVGVAAPRPAQVLAELAATLILAGTSWYFLERPIIAWAARFGGHKPSSPANKSPPS